MTVQQTCEYLKAQNQILILCHQSPDGDTLGSGFGLYYALRAMGKQVRVACSDPIPPQFSFLLPQQMPDFAPQCVATVDVADPQLLGMPSTMAVCIRRSACAAPFRAPRTSL